jgi:hypothetical protein
MTNGRLVDIDAVRRAAEALPGLTHSEKIFVCLAALELVATAHAAKNLRPHHVKHFRDWENAHGYVGERVPFELNIEDSYYSLSLGRFGSVHAEFEPEEIRVYIGNKLAAAEAR